MKHAYLLLFFLGMPSCIKPPFSQQDPGFELSTRQPSKKERPPQPKQRDLLKEEKKHENKAAPEKQEEPSVRLPDKAEPLPQEPPVFSDSSEQTEIQQTETAPQPIETSQRPEEKLSQADEFANDQKYAEAIALLNTLGPQTVLYAEAEKKIQTISTQAVQSLRKRAAEAFRESQNVSDSDARLGYLNDAKLFLSSALKDFPKADAASLASVERNLAVIQKNINNIPNHQ